MIGALKEGRGGDLINMKKLFDDSIIIVYNVSNVPMYVEVYE
jgi:hypothetical protein